MAAAAELPEKVVLATAKELQTRFLAEHKDDPDMDPRDLARIGHPSLHYVCKFVYHQMGDATNAYNQMVECAKWRKSFGINDITFDSIDENFFRSGKSYKHGFDREGNHIVILNIYLHYKDSKRVMETYRWVAFCLESQARVYPDSKVCMIFDSSNAGLSNMDMDLVRFIMNCFKTYYPNFLAMILVYGLPWVLQAPWKIVKSWLSERASNKIKFVNKDDITDYIAPENLLEKFGGLDPWKFEYNREEIMNELEKEVEGRVEGEEAEERDDDEDGSEDGDGEEEDRRRNRGDQGEEEEEEEGGRVTTVGSATSEGTHPDVEPEPKVKPKSVDVTQSLPVDGRRRVSFSANLPPSRQSRFGPEEGVGVSHSGAGPEGVLKRSTSEYHRRRHVSSILRNQPRRNSNFDDGHAIRTPDPQSSPYLDINPPDELLFIEKPGSECKCVITLTNISEQALAYKIKTTAPTRYKVRPSLATLEPKSVAKVQVVLVPGNSGPVSQDKFLVQYYPFEAGSKVPDQNDNQLPAFWKALPEQSVKEYRLRCQLTKETVPKKALKLGATPPSPVPSEQKLDERQSTTSTSTSTGTSSIEMKTLHQKVDKLVGVTMELQAALIRTKRLNYVLIALLTILLVTLLFF